MRFGPPLAGRAVIGRLTFGCVQQQLLGLSERIGNVNRGVSHAAMDALPTRTYQDKEKKADEEDNKYGLDRSVHARLADPFLQVYDLPVRVRRRRGPAHPSLRTFLSQVRGPPRGRKRAPCPYI
jgi:hypothetical protein